jgi:N-acetylglucosaminyldiphosphoundecaprenol N-acetyl-beta-D-mannosaminyltransferase
MRSVFNYDDFEFSSRSLLETKDFIVRALNSKSSIEVHLCNLYTLALAHENSSLAEVLKESDLNIADGYYLSKGLGKGMPIRGMDLFLEIISDSNLDASHFFYGGQRGQEQEILDAIRAINPGIKIARIVTPNWTNLESDQTTLERILGELKPSIVWIGTGTPRQDFAVHQFAKIHNAVYVPIGAVFDFLLDPKQVAPGYIRKLGLEWSYRLLKNPRRLYRRYLIDIPKFLFKSLLKI